MLKAWIIFDVQYMHLLDWLLSQKGPSYESNNISFLWNSHFTLFELHVPIFIQ
jgi:hypothetical protein